MKFDAQNHPRLHDYDGRFCTAQAERAYRAGQAHERVTVVQRIHQVFGIPKTTLRAAVTGLTGGWNRDRRVG
jgi:hypothetical protein